MKVRIDHIDMDVKTLLRGFNSKTVDGVMLMNDDIYCFNHYSIAKFNGHIFRLSDNEENKMFEDIFLAINAINKL